MRKVIRNRVLTKLDAEKPFRRNYANTWGTYDHSKSAPRFVPLPDENRAALREIVLELLTHFQGANDTRQHTCSIVFWELKKRITYKPKRRPAQHNCVKSRWIRWLVDCAFEHMNLLEPEQTNFLYKFTTWEPYNRIKFRSAQPKQSAN